eukprot:9898309-Alexandrium_andersonii.AAC.1
MPRSPGSSRRPAHPVRLRRVGTRLWPGSGLWGSKITGCGCQSPDGAAVEASGGPGRGRGLQLGRRWFGASSPQRG